MSESNNRNWAEGYLRRRAPGLKYRWEYFEEIVKKAVPPSGRWLDIGCGDNRLIAKLATAGTEALGVDIERHPELVDERFLKADIYQLPIASGSVDLITLRFVAEHIGDPDKAMAECFRILQKGGKLIAMTTNKNSPWILPARFMPHEFKRWLASRIFGEEARDLQPTYHRLNSQSDFVRHLSGFQIEKFEYVQDSNYFRKSIFRMHVLWHRLTESFNVTGLRTNIITVLTKR